MPKISVVIPVYNTDKYLAECLDSVVAQTFSDIEIICINDGSTDNSQKILDKYAKKDKRIVLLNQKNAGVSAARNLGVKHSKSKYIYPLDSDDVIFPNTLEKLYNAMLANKGDIITCRVKYFGKESGEMRLMPPTKYNMVQANCLVNAALFRKSDFDLSGGYRDTELEDYDLWLNMMFNHNKKIYRVPEILFCYRIKDKIESRNASCNIKIKDITGMLYKHYPSIKIWLLINKLTKPFVKFARFLFRIENDQVKIFKTPVYNISTQYPEIAIISSFSFWEKDAVYKVRWLFFPFRYLVKVLLHPSRKPVYKRSLKEKKPFMGHHILGHYALGASLLRGLNILNVPFVYNKVTRRTKHIILLWCDRRDLAKVVQIRQKYNIETVLTVPTACKDDNSMLYEFAKSNSVDFVLCGSESVCLGLSQNINDGNKNKLKAWPSGVEIRPLNQERQRLYNKCIVYYKQNKKDESILELLRGLRIDYVVFEYGHYDWSDWFKCLDTVDFVIILGGSETQGIAHAEVWERDIPTFIKTTKKFGKCASPYLTDKTGVFFDDTAELEKIISKYYKSASFRKQFTPRKFVLDNLSDVASVQKLLNLCGGRKVVK